MTGHPVEAYEEFIYSLDIALTPPLDGIKGQAAHCSNQNYGLYYDHRGEPKLEVREMKDLQISEDILPIGEFKTHASGVIRRLQATKRPFVITQNGKPAAVLLTPAEFDRLNEHARFLDAVDDGLSDSIAGRVMGDAELTRELDEALGPLEQ